LYFIQSLINLEYIIKILKNLLPDGFINIIVPLIFPYFNLILGSYEVPPSYLIFINLANIYIPLLKSYVFFTSVTRLVIYIYNKYVKINFLRNKNVLYNLSTRYKLLIVLYILIKSNYIAYNTFIITGLSIDIYLLNNTIYSVFIINIILVLIIISKKYF